MSSTSRPRRGDERAGGGEVRRLGPGLPRWPEGRDGRGGPPGLFCSASGGLRRRRCRDRDGRGPTVEPERRRGGGEVCGHPFPEGGPAPSPPRPAPGPRARRPSPRTRPLSTPHARALTHTHSERQRTDPRSRERPGGQRRKGQELGPGVAQLCPVEHFSTKTGSPSAPLPAAFRGSGLKKSYFSLFFKSLFILANSLVRSPLTPSPFLAPLHGSTLPTPTPSGL